MTYEARRLPRSSRGRCERLAEALDHRVPGTRPFPRDLFDLGLGDPAVASAPVPTRRDPLPVRAGAVVDLQLDRVWPGARHTAHFNQVRWWSTPKRGAMTYGRGSYVSSPTRSDRMSGSPCRSLRLTHGPRRAAWRPGMERGRVVRPRLPGAVEAGQCGRRFAP